MLEWRRQLVCAYDVYEKVKARFPRREINTSTWLENGWFCYRNGKGQIGHVRVADGTIWASAEFPYRVKIWPRHRGRWTSQPQVQSIPRPK